MPRYDDPERPFYFGEVIGSAMSYHLPTCHIIRQIERRNYKRLRNWEEAARLGLNPCPHCRPPKAAMVSDESDFGAAERVPLTANDLGELRRALMTLLIALEPRDLPSVRENGPAALIERLSKVKIIPRDVAACMRTITEIRNAAEYEANISRARTSAVEAALQVIREWADASGIALPDGLKV
jgi:hypothetical protein